MGVEIKKQNEYTLRFNFVSLFLESEHNSFESDTTLAELSFKFYHTVGNVLLIVFSVLRSDIYSMANLIIL